MISIWNSGDRKTCWTKTLTKTLEDGTKETWVVEKVSVLHPKSQQVQLRDVGARVIDGRIELMNIKTGEAVRHTSYYCFEQSFSGGPGSKGDLLGGFSTGQYVECYETKYKSNMERLKSLGFEEEKDGNKSS